MRLRSATSAGALSLFLLAGCASVPEGPTVPVMPAKGKSFSQFQSEDAECQDYAAARVERSAHRANDRALATALIGAAIGAGLGAAAGEGEGEAITTGAIAGGAIGTSIGANDSRFAQGTIQGRYNLAYAQCMHGKGNRIPGADDEEGPPPGYGDRYDRDYPPPPPSRY
jgi:outer membrane lipoprotein SlyB